MSKPISAQAEALAAEMRETYKMRGSLSRWWSGARRRPRMRDADLLLACRRRRPEAFRSIGTHPDHWVPTHDHNPTLKSKKGTRVPSNSRLAHGKCNKVDVTWKSKIGPMLDKGLSLKEISEVLNDKGVEDHRGQAGRTPRSVRHAFVS